MSDLILYQTEDGLTRVQLRVVEGGVWLSQMEIAELFATTKQNVSLHLANVLKDGELAADSVVKESLTTAADGKNYRTKLYRLEMILAVGYRVRGHRGTQFRQWATARLSEYLVKGFAMDDERLKNPPGHGQKDYFEPRSSMNGPTRRSPSWACKPPGPAVWCARKTCPSPRTTCRPMNCRC